MKKELVGLIQVGVRYDADDRSNLLIQAENNIGREDCELLNIRKDKNKNINGRTSKRIFSEFFNINCHVYSGRHSISITGL